MRDGGLKSNFRILIPNIACRFIWNAKVSKIKVAKISAPNKPS